jgi:hypothetical protein
MEIYLYKRAYFLSEIDLYQDIVIVSSGRLAKESDQPRVLRLPPVIGIFNWQVHCPVQNGGRK